MGDFEQDLKLFVEKANYLIPVIKNDMEALLSNKHGCKTSAVNARNKLKELTDLCRKLKKSSLEKARLMPKREVLRVRKPIKNIAEEILHDDSDDFDYAVDFDSDTMNRKDTINRKDLIKDLRNLRNATLLSDKELQSRDDVNATLQQPEDQQLNGRKKDII